MFVLVKSVFPQLLSLILQLRDTAQLTLMQDKTLELDTVASVSTKLKFGYS